MGEYQVNKGVGRQGEFQGLTAQYLVLFVAGLLGVFVCFVPVNEKRVCKSAE